MDRSISQTELRDVQILQRMHADLLERLCTRMREGESIEPGALSLLGSKIVASSSIVDIKIALHRKIQRIEIEGNWGRYVPVLFSGGLAFACAAFVSVRRFAANRMAYRSASVTRP